MMHMWWQPWPCAAEGTEGGGDTGGDKGDGAAEPRGMLDLVPGEEPKPAAKGHPAGAGGEPKGEGDNKPVRPAAVPEKFWDPDKGAIRTEALLKAYADAERVISRGEHKPPAKPEDYQLPKGDGIPEGLVKPDDPLWQATVAAAHARGLSQADLEALAGPFLKTLGELTKDKLPPDPEAEKAARLAAFAEEKKKLGPQAEAMIAGVGTWLRGLGASGVLGPEEIDSLFTVADAAGVRALAKLREMAGEQPLGVDPAGLPDIGSEREARALMREGYAKGEHTAEGKSMIEKGRAMLAALERAGVKLDPRGGGRGLAA